MTTWQIEPLGTWARPVTDPRASSGRFRATWDQTLKMLVAEIDLLQPTSAIAIQVDADASDIRRDGMLRARAKVNFPGVVVSFTSALHGPLSYATDAYEQRWSGDLASWQANVRAIALSLEALRAVDRYGVSRSGEQYVGWRAIEASSSPVTFGSADEALRWMQDQVGDSTGSWPIHKKLPRLYYRELARRMHPDAGGDPADWARLDEARRLLEDGGLW